MYEIDDQITNANRMLVLIKRSPANVHNVNTHRCLYLEIERPNLAYASSLESTNYHSVCGTRNNSTEGNNVYNGSALSRRNFSEKNSLH